MHDASPPNVVGPSSSASVDALNATVVPSGTAATPARIVNVSAHDAPGEQTIPHDQLAWHRVASPSVGAPPAHVNVGAAHEDVTNALARASAPTLDARSAVTTTIARDIGVRDNASRPDDDDDASMRRPRTTRRNLPRPIARVPSSATSTSASARDDGTALDDDETFYAYDEDAWRAFERAFGTTPREPWFGPLQLALTVVLAGTVDAGWSGDWSRVGALTKAREADARAFVECVCVANASMALVARDVAIRRGMDGTRAFAKTLVVGFVGVVDACFGGADARDRRARDATTRGGGKT